MHHEIDTICPPPPPPLSLPPPPPPAASAYLLQPLPQARAAAAAGLWAGGVNRTALRMLEERAYGWFWFLRGAFPAADRPRLALNRSFTGTAAGLTKVGAAASRCD